MSVEYCDNVKTNVYWPLSIQCIMILNRSQKFKNTLVVSLKRLYIYVQEV